ncbi:hypothetical protein GCM10027610_061710 [Dactylosporangium cerinum]
MQARPDLVEPVQRRGLLSGRGEQQHEPGLQRLVQRGAVGGPFHGRQHQARQSGGEGGVGGGAGRCLVFAVQGAEHGPAADLRRDGAGRGSLPQVQRAPEQRRVGPGLAQQRPELEQVDGVCADGEPVAAAGPDQPAPRVAVGQPGFEGPAEQPEAAVHRVDGGCRRALAPQHVDDLGEADRVPGPCQQQGEDSALLRGAEVDLGAGTPDPDRAQDREPHVCHTSDARAVAPCAASVT